MGPARSRRRFVGGSDSPSSSVDNPGTADPTSFEDYRDEKEAMRLYARLGERDASHCIGCPAPCAGACPHGVPIQEKMLAAHAQLRFA